MCLPQRGVQQDRSQMARFLRRRMPNQAVSFQPGFFLPLSLLHSQPHHNLLPCGTRRDQHRARYKDERHEREAGRSAARTAGPAGRGALRSAGRRRGPPALTHRLKCSMIFSSRTFSGKLPTQRCLVSRTMLRAPDGALAPGAASPRGGGGHHASGPAPGCGSPPLPPRLCSGLLRSAPAGGSPAARRPSSASSARPPALRRLLASPRSRTGPRMRMRTRRGGDESEARSPIMRAQREREARSQCCLCSPRMRT